MLVSVILLLLSNFQPILIHLALKFIYHFHLLDINQNFIISSNDNEQSILIRQDSLSELKDLAINLLKEIISKGHSLQFI